MPAIALVQLRKSEHLKIPYMNVPPLGLLYIGSALKRAGYRVRIWHVTEDELETTIARIVDDRPLYVGLSVFTGSAMGACVALSMALKRADASIPVVWGNVHPSSLPRQCLREDYIDYICIGEGEDSAVELAQALEGERALQEVAGIGYKGGDGAIRLNAGRSGATHLDDYPLEWSLVALEQYIGPFNKFRRTLAVTTSRGCPHRCTFCYNEAFHRRRWRGHSADFVISQLQQLIRTHRLDAIRFLDDNFFARPERAFTIVEALNIPFFATLRIDYLNAHFVSRLCKTKCFELLLGLESGSDRILRQVMQKDFTVSDTVTAVKRLKRRSTTILLTCSFIFGVPGETPMEFARTLELVFELLRIYPNSEMAAGCYLPYPGSRLYQTARRKGFVPPASVAGWENMDRRKHMLPLAWIDWITSRETAKTRDYLSALSFCCRNRLPFFKDLIKWRLRNRNFVFALDLLFLQLVIAVKEKFARMLLRSRFLSQP